MLRCFTLEFPGEIDEEKDKIMGGRCMKERGIYGCDVPVQWVYTWI